MIKTQGFLHLTISVTDVARATAFYQDVLGCELVRMNSKNTMAFMKTGEDFFVLTSMPNHVKPNLAGPLDLETTLFHHAMIVEPDEWDRALEYLKAEGIEVLHLHRRRPHHLPGPPPRLYPGPRRQQHRNRHHLQPRAGPVGRPGRRPGLAGM